MEVCGRTVTLPIEASLTTRQYKGNSTISIKYQDCTRLVLAVVTETNTKNLGFAGI